MATELVADWAGALSAIEQIDLRSKVLIPGSTTEQQAEFLVRRRCTNPATLSLAEKLLCALAMGSTTEGQRILTDMREATRQALTRREALLADLSGTWSIATNLNARGPWTVPEGTRNPEQEVLCKEFGARMYDIPCTRENVLSTLFLPSMYDTARVKLAPLVAEPRAFSPNDWLEVAMRWMSVAHYATNFRSQFIYDRETISDRQYFGPPRARAFRNRLAETALRNGRVLVWPKAVDSGALFSLDEPLLGDGYLSYADCSSEGRNWLYQVSLLGANRMQRAMCPVRERLATLPIQQQMGSSEELGLVLMERHDPLLADHNVGIGRTKWGTLYSQAALPTYGSVREYLRIWASWLSAENNAETMFLRSWENWLRYAQLFPPENMGLTLRMINGAISAAESARLQAEVIQAGEAVAFAIGFITAALTATAASNVASVVVGVVLALIGLIVSAITGGIPAQPKKCDWAGLIPVPPVHRSIFNPECDVRVGLDRSTADMVNSMITAGERGGIQFRRPPWAGGGANCDGLCPQAETSGLPTGLLLGGGVAVAALLAIAIGRR